jgi:hypothetical protein
VLADDAAPDLLDECRACAGELVEKLDVAGVVHRLLSCRHSYPRLMACWPDGLMA